MLCTHCQNHEMMLPWIEPDGVELPHCICGYVAYESMPSLPLPVRGPYKSRTYGKRTCIVCGKGFKARSPNAMTCSLSCHKKRNTHKNRMA